jgi:tRNA pseudouridine65 synthase
LNQYVYPVHRLDRPTSGVLLFALDPGTAGKLASLFEKREVQKTYLAIVRGQLDESGEINRPLKDAERHDQLAAEAATSYRRLAWAELNPQVSPLVEKHYSLAEVTPHTGRMHQIRKHFRSIAHPIIGDTRYGKGDHNRLFRDVYGVGRLLLHASLLEFVHPGTDKPITITSSLPADFKRLVKELFPRYEED